MGTTTLSVRVGEAPEIEAFLGQRLYEFNSAAINRFDGESFSAVQESADGVIEAGICGYTWAGLCFVTYLWVDEHLRGAGLGSDLLAAAERHGAERGCAQVLLYTHSFQAPGFYRAHGYTPVAEVPDHPVGYSSIFFAKRLDGRQPATVPSPRPAASASEVLGVLDRFTAAFNRQDAAAMDATLHFPHFLSGSPPAVWERPGNLSPTFFPRLAATGWAFSRYTRREPLLVSDDRVHVLVEYERCRQDGSVLDTHSAIWVVAHIDGRWGIQLRSNA